MQSKKIAACGVLCALAVVIMLIGSVIWVGVYAAPLLSIWLLLPLQELYGRKAALTAYFAVALLSLILLPDRELALFYCAFGWWPAARPTIQRIRNKTLRLAVKLVIYFTAMSVMLWAVIKVLGIPASEEGGIFSPVSWLPLQLSVMDLILIAAGALLFLFCDSTLEQMSAALTKRFRKLMSIH